MQKAKTTIAINPAVPIMSFYAENKAAISAWSCDPAVNGFQTTNDYILGLGGEQVTEMGVGGTSSGSTTNGLIWQHTNVWAAGKLLATYDGDCTGTAHMPLLRIAFSLGAIASLSIKLSWLPRQASSLPS